MIVLKSLIACVTFGSDHLPSDFHRLFQPSAPRSPIMTVSHRCSVVHWSPTEIGSTSGSAAFTLARSAMKSATEVGGVVMPALLTTCGLNHSMLARWMFAGTE